MREIVDFIKENIQEIAIVVVVVLLLLIIINIKGINLNEPKPESKLIQQVTVETFDTDTSLTDTSLTDTSLTTSFCKSHLGNSLELEQSCNQLTETNCNSVKCCVYTNTGNNSKCVAGNMHGPTYKTDKNGKLITIDSYYYLGKCQGECPT